MKTLTKKSLLALLSLAPALVQADTTIFNDNLSSSTINGASIPTGTSTSYDVASSKNATTSIAAGDLKMGMAATTSGFVQAQAVFASSAVSLTGVGDSIRLTATFTDTLNLLNGTSSFICYGLYNSAGSLPLTGLTSSGLSATAGSPNSTGGVQLWQGYVGRLAGSGGSSSVYLRPQQSGVDTSSQNQDLIGNNWGGGAYDTPGGTTLGSVASTLSLTVSAQYTLAFSLTLTAANTYDISSILYDGVGTGGTVLSTQTVSASGANFLTSSFDGLAIGYRHSGTSMATTIDINAITVTANISTVPEPSSAALVLSGITLLGMIQRSRRA